jgi:hypothetical protein
MIDRVNARLPSVSAALSFKRSSVAHKIRNLVGAPDEPAATGAARRMTSRSARIFNRRFSSV